MINKLLEKMGYTKSLEIETLKAEIRLLTKMNQVPEQNTLQRFSKKIRRDNPECDICHETKPETLTVHHLWPRSVYPQLAPEPDNVVVLCECCHNDYHKYWKDASETSPVTYDCFKTLHQAKPAQRRYNLHLLKLQDKIQSEV